MSPLQGFVNSLDKREIMTVICPSRTTNHAHWVNLNVSATVRAGLDGLEQRVLFLAPETTLFLNTIVTPDVWSPCDSLRESL
jgi:hypothetical protein